MASSCSRVAREKAAFDFWAPAIYARLVPPKKDRRHDNPGRPPSTNRNTSDSVSLHMRLSSAEHAMLVERLGAERLASKILDLALVASDPHALTPEYANLLKLCGNKDS